MRNDSAIGLAAVHVPKQVRQVGHVVDFGVAAGSLEDNSPPNDAFPPDASLDLLREVDAREPQAGRVDFGRCRQLAFGVPQPCESGVTGTIDDAADEARSPVVL